LRWKVNDKDASNGGGEQGIHGRHGLGIERQQEAPRGLARQQRDGDDGRKEGEARVREGRIPGIEDEGQLVDFPIAAAEAVGDDKKDDDRYGDFARIPGQTQRLPLFGEGLHEALVREHVKGIPDQAPAVGLTKSAATDAAKIVSNLRRCSLGQADWTMIPMLKENEPQAI